MKHRTLRLVLWRFLMSLPLLFGVVVVTFVLIRALPGDPAVIYASGPNTGAKEIEAVREAMGLNKSVPEQFLRYLSDLASLNFGNSMVTGQPVIKDFASSDYRTCCICFCDLTRRGCAGRNVVCGLS